ncbi:MAG: phycobilisome protein [Cyanobacteria bacterium P01_D01_bin.105]
MQALSERAKQLIPKAQIVSFESWQDMSNEAIARFHTANEEKRYLTNEDLDAVGAHHASTLQRLRDQAPAIVDEARAEVLQAHPGILEPGGGLYPAIRAEACWRDFWQFLRCITYGIASAHQQYTSAEGLAAMEQLYEELKVPLPAMVTGLKGIKKASLSRVPAEQHELMTPYFDHLITHMAHFLDATPVS